MPGIHLSEIQQQAVIGHALQNPQVWDILQGFGFTSKWISSAPVSEAVDKIESFNKEYNRFPYSLEEITEFVKDDLVKEATKRSLLKCIESKKLHPWDVLQEKLSSWAKARIIFESSKTLAEKFNSDKYEESFDLWQENALALEKVDAICNKGTDSFESVAVRITKESQERLLDSQNSIPYAGCTFLQDSLVSILPTDVVLLGATSGSGKTEMAKIIASEVAREKQVPVHYFALEAEQYEIERRIKYGMIANWFKDEHPSTPKGMISYANWRNCRLEAEFSKYEQRAADEFKKNYSMLHTYYRMKNNFGIKDLDKEIYKLRGKSKLIILDHIHFVDLDAKNEVAELSLLIKMIRETAQVLKIPVICVAHLRKSGKSQGLVPEQEDFHGASNLFKTATVGIMMSKCGNVTSSDARSLGSPTLIKAVKSRLDGSKLFYTGMIFFNTYTNMYTPYYSVGQLSNNGQKWQALKGELPPWINIERNVCDVSDVE